MSKNISLKDLLDTTFTINDKGEMVGEFTLKRINMIGDILINYYMENERLKKELEIEKDISDGMLETIDKAIELIEKDYIYIQHGTYNKLLKILDKEENNESSDINREIN